ncbi:hypothetical protein DRQ50_14840 [bacterium]|nr:MAG: hypothetical protein DRQ50_14840 [bacterium]
MKRLVCLSLVLLLLTVSACSDDDPATPVETFKVTFQVRDTAGDPVAGLKLSLFNDNPYLQWKAGIAALTTIQFTHEVACHATLTVEDIEGNTVRILADNPLAAGVFNIAWDARDGEGTHLPGGRYTFRYVARDNAGVTLFEDTRDILMTAFYVPVATTDADGKAVLTDRRHFPHFYDRPAMMATDENGLPIGPLVLTSDMRIFLEDGDRNLEVYERAVEAGAQLLELVWTGGIPPAPAENAVILKAADVIDPEPEFELGLPHPNPFN